MSDDGHDAKSGADDVELLRKESAGKDRRITELYARIRELEREREAGAQDGAVTEQQRRRLAEIAGSLKAREEELAVKQKAVQIAAEKGISPDLLLRGTEDLDGFLAELAGFEKQIRASMGWRGGPAPNDSPPDLSKLSRQEIARIPDKILDKLMGAEG